MVKGLDIMCWGDLLSSKRFGMENYKRKASQERTEFQRDYDRLIFSAPFRRLQNKTQVFPLPGSVFVHNRLTHSLEVSCVGRSLGSSVAHILADEKYHDQPWRRSLYDLGNIVSAACLAHDLGNPPFGHSGEKAIAAYFTEGHGKRYKKELTQKQWSDIINFEGNANAFRLLTHKFRGRREGGFAMTYATLASIVKYPHEATHSKNGKFGFFQSERENFETIAKDMGLLQISEGAYVRHPLVFLVEAADDICYQVMDIEDAVKLKLVSFEQAKELLLSFFDKDSISHMEQVMECVEDQNEQIAYLRSSVIGHLAEECSQLFIDKEEEILKGDFSKSLIDNIRPHSREAYQRCTALAKSKIYSAQEVLDIELSGYKIISTLMDTLLGAAMSPDNAYSKFVLKRVPYQYDMDAQTTYEKIQAVLDCISGMTDVYALDLYRKINGMSLPNV